MYFSENDSYIYIIIQNYPKQLKDPRPLKLKQSKKQDKRFHSKRQFHKMNNQKRTLRY